MSWVTNFFWENLGLKLAALALAVVVWGTVQGDVTTEILVTIPLEFRDAPEGMKFSAFPSEVRVRVRGSRRIVMAANHADFIVSLDLSKLALGEYLFRLEPASVQAPPFVEVVQIVPEQVRITAERPQTE
jgi:YbbR domain-containing protein